MNSKVRHPSVVLAETDANSLTALRAQVERLDYLVHVADVPSRLMAVLKRVQPAALLIDVDFGGDGFQRVSQIQEQGLFSCMSILFLAFRPDVEDAVRAMRMDAEDYLVKPVSQNRLSKALLRTLPHQSEQPAHAIGSEHLVGNSRQMQELRKALQLAAPTDATVLISGEPGTGTHQLAKELHRMSSRRARPFVSVNTSSWRSEDPIQSEMKLFGHEKGVVTGTNVMRTGACCRANGGTLFFNEIGELPAAHQSILLRFLQERRIRPVGSQSDQDIDVRIIAASKYTNAELAQGRISSELLFELNVVPLAIPPLRSRTQDMESLVHLLCRRFAHQHGRGELVITENVVDSLRKLPWPGNVRQLSNFVERMVVFSRGDTLSECPELLLRDLDVVEPNEEPPRRLSICSSEKHPGCDELSVMDQVKVQAIQAALADADGHVGKAAKILGIGQATLYRKLHRFGIRRSGSEGTGKAAGANRLPKYAREIGKST